MGLAASIEKNWYGRAAGNFWLLPLWALFVMISSARRVWYRLFTPEKNAVPVLIVGNIAVGGTGKTPLITCIYELARAQGMKVGVVSRGYGGSASQYPLLVGRDTSVEESGDEPALLAGRGIPVAVDPVRKRAVSALAAQVDLVLSDDGLQHYGMSRDAEIVVSDATRGFGNGWRLPVGPLREPVSRIDECDLHLVNGRDFTIEPDALIKASGHAEPASSLHGLRVHAVAGIGNPARFFDTLRMLGVDVIEHPFADHHVFVQADVTFDDDLPVVMTEKDWVKCRNFEMPDAGYLRITATPTPEVTVRIQQLLNKLGANPHG